MLQRLCRQPASCWHRTSDRNLLSCSKSSAHRQCARTARHGVRQHLVRAQAVAEASKSAGRKPRGRAASSNAMEPDANEEGMLELPVVRDSLLLLCIAVSCSLCCSLLTAYTWGIPVC